MTQEIPPATEGRARALLGDLVEGRWEQAREAFEAGLRRQANADQIARGWTNVTRAGGSFEGIGAPAARQSGGCTVVTVPLIFRAGDATGRVVVGADGQVTGLGVEYPHRHRLDPRRVHVFVIANGDPEVAKALHARL